jgi:hypothetical protein
MTRRFAIIAALVALVVLGCGGSPASQAGPVLVLDLKIEQPDEQATIRGASLLLDGTVVSHFQQPRPEKYVVFSRNVDGVQPGEHTIEVRIDAQTASPTLYVAGGFATWKQKPLPLVETGGPLATGQAYRWRITL